VEYLDHIARLESVDPELAGDLKGVDTLEKVLGWAKRSGLRLDGCDVIAQDEYCHDFLIPLADGRRWLVFGMT
jgi:hypothetical protein